MSPAGPPMSAKQNDGHQDLSRDQRLVTIIVVIRLVNSVCMETVYRFLHGLLARGIGEDPCGWLRLVSQQEPKDTHRWAQCPPQKPTYNWGQ